MRRFCKKLTIIALVVLLAACAAIAWADVGSFSGDSDWGGGSDWGSSDWGSSDWGSSDYDYNWGSGTTSDYYSNSSGDNSDGGGFGWVIAAIVVVIVVIATSRSKKNKSAKTSVTIPTVSAPQNLKPMSEFTAIDPLFNESEFKEKLSNLYVRMQNQWTAKDFEPMRPYFTDAMYAQFARQLEQIKAAGQTNYVERISVLSVDCMGFAQDETNNSIVARITTRIVDYTVNDASGEVVSGSKTKEKFLTYDWTLIRAKDVMTQENADVESTSCPHCGAPLQINQSSLCPYCGSVVTINAADWVISSIKGISQRTA